MANKPNRRMVRRKPKPESEFSGGGNPRRGSRKVLSDADIRLKELDLRVRVLKHALDRAQQHQWKILGLKAK